MTSRPAARILPAILVPLAASSTAQAFPSFVNRFQTQYPTTTIPQRMFATIGATCWTCHHPQDFGQNGNCYREDLKVMLNAGSSIQQAIAAIDLVDSDGDGVPNGVEARTPRAGSSDVGYAPGLRGEAGLDACFDIPDTQVSGQLETPPSYCYANCDGSTIAPAINAGDFTCFLDSFRAAASLPAELRVKHYANCDGSTIAPAINAGDFVCFLSRFRKGCI